jgi:hypothetical protein
MIRAACIILAALPLPAAAQSVACAFTIVCAPEIECERHEGIPFEIAETEGAYSIEIDGEDVAGTVLSPAPDLTLVFAAGDESLLFTLSRGGDGALSRHRTGPGDRLGVATFLGPCVTA